MFVLLRFVASLSASLTSRTLKAPRSNVNDYSSLFSQLPFL